MSKTNRKGYAIVAVLAAIAAAGILMVPLTRWFVSMSQGTEELEGKLALQAILKDYWERLNAASYDEIQAAIDTKGTTWTEKTGESDRYTITTSFSDTGKYANATCYAGEPGTDDRKCRRVSIQINDNLNGLTQAVNLTKADAAAGGSALENRLASLENNFSSFKSQTNSKFSSTDSKFGDYYKKSEVNSKLGTFACDGEGKEFNGDRCVCPSDKIYMQGSTACQACSFAHRPNSNQTACEEFSCGSGYYIAGTKCKKYNIRRAIAGTSEFCIDLGRPSTFAKGGCCGEKVRFYVDDELFAVFTINGLAETKYGAWYANGDDSRCTIGGKTVNLTGSYTFKPAPGSPKCLASFTISTTDGQTYNNSFTDDEFAAKCLAY